MPKEIVYNEYGVYYDESGIPWPKGHESWTAEQAGKYYYDYLQYQDELDRMFSSQLENYDNDPQDDFDPSR
jgi:hypothetical protein